MLLPFNVTPQLATLTKEIPEGQNWIYETKYDGYRILLFKNKKDLQLITRGNKDWSLKFPTIYNEGKLIKADSIILDGEVVVELKGKTIFQELQNVFQSGDDSNLFYYVFDILYLNGEDLRNKPLIKRKEILKTILGKSPIFKIKLGNYQHGNGEKIFEEACLKDLEGIVIKKADSVYEGDRNKDWLKIKCIKRQEFVIGGYIPTKSEDIQGIGALLLGIYENNKFKYVGKSGTGFDFKTRKYLETILEKIKSQSFYELNLDKIPKDAIFVKPIYVIEATFVEWTKEDLLRQAVFKGLREDKNPKLVIKEMVPKLAFKYDPNSTKNEGRFRLIDPKEFDSTSYRRWKKWGKIELPEGISLIVGRHKEKNRLLPQTIRFNKEKWTEKEAKKWWRKKGSKLFKKYKTWKWVKVSTVLKKISKLIIADFPKHPNKKIISKNIYYPKGLTEEDIWNYYDKNKEKIFEYLKGKEILVVIKTDDGSVVKRNDPEGNPYRINKLSDFEYLNNGRNVEFHIVSPKITNLAWIDLDPGSLINFKDTTNLALDLKNKIKQIDYISNAKIKYSGGRGFHILLDLKSKKDVNLIRKNLKEFLEDYIEGKEEYVLNPPKRNQIRIDISTLHYKGSIRAPYSLNLTTGLASLFKLDPNETKIK